MPFLKALLFLWCFLPLRFRDMRRISLRARRLASSSDGGSPDGGRDRVQPERRTKPSDKLRVVRLHVGHRAHRPKRSLRLRRFADGSVNHFQ